MRIAYLLTWSSGSWSGVFKKVADQVSAWTNAGAEVGIFVASTAAALESWNDLPQTQHVSVFGGRRSSITSQLAVFSAARAWAPDIAYVRTTPRHAIAWRSLRELPHVVEIQSDDLAEARMVSRPRLWLSSATRGTCHGHARGLVFVTHELAASPSYAMFTPNRIVIGNGIDLARVTALPPVSDAGPPRLVFMGHPGTPWHGLDDVHALARSRPDWQFDLVGPSASAATTTSPNVTFHGELASDAYLPILARADVGLGSLALYLNGMDEASPLKTREYLALGLPVVGGYRDTDLPDDSPVFLRVPNRAGGIVERAADLEQFIAQWRGRRVAHEQIANLDTAVKETTRLDFLQACARLS